MEMSRHQSVLQMKIHLKALSSSKSKCKASKSLEKSLLKFVLTMSIPEVHSSLVKQLINKEKSLNSQIYSLMASFIQFLKALGLPLIEISNSFLSTLQLQKHSMLSQITSASRMKDREIIWLPVQLEFMSQNLLMAKLNSMQYITSKLKTFASSKANKN